MTRHLCTTLTRRSSGFFRADTLVTTLIFVGLALLLIPAARKLAKHGHDTFAQVLYGAVVLAVVVGCIYFALDCIALRRNRTTKGGTKK
jgi:hypothetical protein